MFLENYLTSPLKNKTSKKLEVTPEDLKGGPRIYSLLPKGTSNFSFSSGYFVSPVITSIFTASVIISM